ncbi:MAG: DUF4352 domain-containing protein [Chloroflexia bacterium]|nr:DUF4352 domain-containing protein [Chloroflexia bacterium]
MRRIVSLVALLVVLGLAPGPVASVAAQGDAPTVGTDVPYVDAEGVEHGLVTVTEVADPFTDFNPDQPPEAGRRYVLLTVAFEAAADQPFEADPYDLHFQDTDGYLWSLTSVPRPADVVIPELQSQTMAPGNRVSGVVGFVVPEDAELDQIFYQPESGRLILLADLLPGAGPTLGDEIAYSDAEGGEALVSVTEVADPFTEFNPDYPPEAGSRYVLLTVSFENAGQLPFDADPYDLLVRDADGFLWSLSSVQRPADVVMPEVQSQTMAPGNRVSGVVGFVVPEDADLTGVHFQPESGRLVLLADLAGAAPGAESSATPATSGVAGTALAAGECDGVEAWLMATATRVQRAAAMSREDATLEDIAILEEHVTEYAALSAAQGTDPVPAAAVAINDLVIAVLTAYEAALTQILAAEEPGKETALELVEAMNTFNDAGQQAGEIRQEIAELAAGCGIDL